MLGEATRNLDVLLLPTWQSDGQINSDGQETAPTAQWRRVATQVEFQSVVEHAQYMAAHKQHQKWNCYKHNNIKLTTTHTLRLYSTCSPPDTYFTFSHQVNQIAVARPQGGWTPPPTVLQGHSRVLHRTDEKILGYPPPRNVVPANTLVLVAHLVTFSETNETSFTTGLKSPQLHGASLDPHHGPSAALPLDPAGDSAAHSSPCTFSLTPPAELRQNKQRKRSPHH